MPTQKSTTSTPHTAYRRRIEFLFDTRDFAYYWDGQLVGYARTLHDAEVALNLIEAHSIERARVEAQIVAPAPADPIAAMLAGDGLRIASPDEPGWTYRLNGGRTLWVTDEPAPSIEARDEAAQAAAEVGADDPDCTPPMVTAGCLATENIAAVADPALLAAWDMDDPDNDPPPTPLPGAGEPRRLFGWEGTAQQWLDRVA